MEAKDTVMSPEEKSKAYNDCLAEFRKLYAQHLVFASDREKIIDQALAKAQAEITFPLGKQEGIKLVVDFVDQYALVKDDPDFTGLDAGDIVLYKGFWQAFKERVRK